MTIDDLRGLVAVARTGSFSLAGAQTFRTQPAVSLQIARLERELGVRLLDRSGLRRSETGFGGQARGEARPTREGAAVVALAEEILDRVRRIGELRGVAGSLVVGAGQTVARAVLPSALRRFRRRFPRVAVTVRTDPSRALLGALAAGRVDLAVLSMPLSADGVEVRPFRRYHFVAVGRGVRDPLILPEAGSAMRAHIEASLLAHGIAPRVAMETSSSDLALAMARSGVGTAIVASFSGPGRRIDRWVPAQTLCLAWRRGTTDLARDALADLIRTNR